MSAEDHKAHSAGAVRLGVITLSTTRSESQDQSGRWICHQAEAEGHQVVYYKVIPDDSATIADTVSSVIQFNDPRILLLNGGTGITLSDVTIESVKPMFDREMPAFGALFAYLSYKEIGSPAILSRAVAGIIGKTAVFCMPGSLKACQLACNLLIFPELGHIAKHIED